MINLITNGFYGETLHKVLTKISKKIDINYANNIYLHDKISAFKAGHTDWINYNRLLTDVKKYPLDPNELAPLDEKIIREMSDCQRIVLKMIDRRENGRKLSYQNRVDIYYYYLRYWNHIIETKKINIFLSANIPHEVFDYIIYELCKAKGIPTLLLYNESQIADTVLILDDWRKSSTKLEKRYAGLKNKYRDNVINDIKLSNRFEEYYLDRTSDQPAKLFYMNNKFLLFTKIKGLLRTFLKSIELFRRSPFGGLRFILNQIIKKIHDLYLSCFYKYKSISPDLNTPYIYVALQYQPELTTSPLAGAFVDQILIVQMLAKHAPRNTKIYVKEHPVQSSRGRSVSFYRDLLSINNVELVTKKFDSAKLISNAIAVSTATGTVGWEAMCKRKPVLMFGSYTYQFFDGVFKVKTNEDCAKAIRKIVAGKLEITLKNLRIFLKAFEETTICGVADPDYLAISKLDQKDNVRNLSQALLIEIKKHLNEQ